MRDDLTVACRSANRYRMRRSVQMGIGGRSTGGTSPVYAVGDSAGQKTAIIGTADTTANGVEGVATTGNGVQGSATSGNAVLGAATSGYGVKGTATTGAALYGAATAGYGVIAEGDTTSPAVAAFRIVPQDTLPTNALVGDLCVVSAKLYLCTVSHTQTPTFVVAGSQS